MTLRDSIGKDKTLHRTQYVYKALTEWYENKKQTMQNWIYTYSFGGPGKNRSKYIPNFFKLSSFKAMNVGENVLNPLPLITSPESFFQK